MARVGPPATLFPGDMALGAGRAPPTRRPRPRSPADELRGDGHQPELRARRRRQRQPAPTRSSASGRSAPTRRLVAELAAAQVTRLPARRHRRRRQALPRPRRHRDRQPHRPPDHRPHPRGVGAARRAAVPGRDRRRHRLDHDRAHRRSRPSTRPATRPPSPSRSSPASCASELGYDGVVVTDSLGMAGVREKYGDDRVPVLALKAGVDQLLIPPELDVAYNAVLDAVAAGELTEERHRRRRYAGSSASSRASASSTTRTSTRPRWPGRRHPRPPRHRCRRSPTAPPRWCATTPACCRWRSTLVRTPSSQAGASPPPQRSPRSWTSETSTPTCSRPALSCSGLICKYMTANERKRMSCLSLTFVTFRQTPKIPRTYRGTSNSCITPIQFARYRFTC